MRRPSGFLLQFILMPAGLVILVSLALAADYSWTGGVGQGVSEASIQNEYGSSLSIGCPHGQFDTTPGFNIETKGIRWRARQQADVDIVVDGSRYSFSIATGVGGLILRFEARDETDKQNLRHLVDALTRSRQASFLIDFPQQNRSEQFSLRDARRFLLVGGKIPLLDGCV